MNFHEAPSFGPMGKAVGKPSRQTLNRGVPVSKQQNTAQLNVFKPQNGVVSDYQGLASSFTKTYSDGIEDKVGCIF